MRRSSPSTQNKSDGWMSKQISKAVAAIKRFKLKVTAPVVAVSRDMQLFNSNPCEKGPQPLHPAP